MNPRAFRLLPALALFASAALSAQAPAGGGAPGGSGGGMAGGKPFSAALISRADAQALVNRTLDACEALKEPASVYVLDADGNMRAAGSSDNAVPVGQSSAPKKAAAVLAFKSSTRDLEQRIKDDKAFADQYGKDPRYFYHPGALPLYRNGQLVGVLAAGGGHDKDESCALTALAAMPTLKTKP